MIRLHSAFLRTLLAASVVGMAAEPAVTEAATALVMVRVRTRRGGRRREETAALHPMDPAADRPPASAPVSVACRRLSSMVSPAACRAAVSAVRQVRAFDARVRPLR